MPDERGILKDGDMQGQNAVGTVPFGTCKRHGTGARRVERLTVPKQRRAVAAEGAVGGMGDIVPHDQSDVH